MGSVIINPAVVKKDVLITEDDTFSFGDATHRLANLHVNELNADKILGDSVKDNNTYLKWRNQLDSADIDVVAVDTSDDTILNAITGKNLHFQINKDTKWSVDSSGFLVPGADNTYDIGTATAAVKDFYIEGGFTFTGVGNSLIGLNTADASDTGQIDIYAGGGGDPTDRGRGARLSITGNEESAAGSIFFDTGNASGANIVLRSYSTDGIIQFETNAATPRWKMVAAGHFEPIDDSTYDIGSSTTFVRNVYSDKFTGNSNINMFLSTVDAADTGHIHIAGGSAYDDTRGSFVGLYGNEHSTVPGDLQLGAGNVAGAAVDFFTAGTHRWEIENGGSFLPAADNSYDIGSATAAVKDIYLEGTLQATAASQDIGTSGQHFDTIYVDNIVGASAAIGVQANDSYLQWRNQGNTADIDVLKVNTSDETILNSASGKSILILSNETNGWEVDPSGHLFPSGDNSNDIGASTAAVKDFYLEGEQVFTGTTAQIRLNTADASDTGVLFITAGGGSGFSSARGAYLELRGNESASNAGDLFCVAGNVAGGAVRFYTGGSHRWQIENDGDLVPQGAHTVGASGSEVSTVWTSQIQSAAGVDLIAATETYLRSNSSQRWKVASSTGSFQPLLDNTYDIGAATAAVRNLYIESDQIFTGNSYIRSNSADGSDTGTMWITGGGGRDFFGGTRGGSFLCMGNEVAVDGGRAIVASGDDTTGNVTLYTPGTQPIDLYTDGTLRWKVESDGDLVSQGAYNLDMGTGVMIHDNGNVTAAGSDQSGATELNAQSGYVNGADGTKGVKMPAENNGVVYFWYNNTSSTLKVYPPTGSQINGQGTNVAINVPGKNSFYAHRTSATGWGMIVGGV